MFKTKIKNILLTLLAALSMGFSAQVLADYLPIEAYGSNTIAGYPAKLQSSLVTPKQDLLFVVERTDGQVTRVPAEADLEGFAQAEFYQTKQAGDYRVSIVYPNSALSSPSRSFSVLPGEFSPTNSVIKTTDRMPDAGDSTFITVTLYDEYRNAIGGHKVNIFSNRNGDVVTAIDSGLTNTLGEASFKVTSDYPGISYFTAYDVTLNKVLSDRVEIVVMEPVNEEPRFIGGHFLSADLFRSDLTAIGSDEVLPGPVFEFLIEDVPAQVNDGTDQTITITAVDTNGNVAKNYTGTVIFSSTDDNAVLPNNGEYTFRESDLGKFTFNLALRFSELGDHTVQVYDKSDWDISGEYKVNVVRPGSVVDVTTKSNLEIKSPVDGAELGNNLIILSGTGDPYINLKIFDNDVKIGDSETDESGFFSYQIQNLDSGSHMFYVMSDVGGVSASVNIQVDTMPPVLNDFEITPEGTVLPGTALQIKVQSEPGLDEAKIRIQGIEEILNPSDVTPGLYTATIGAPQNEGDFPVDIILVDQLSNQAQLLNKVTVKVVAVPEILPPTISSLEATPGDLEIKLSWDPIEDHDYDIASYRVYYGMSFETLDKMVDTGTDMAEYTMIDLENGQQYFFAVKAVDIKGEESKENGTMVSATPVQEVLEIAPPTVTGLESISGDAEILLSWDPILTHEVGIASYRVYYGTSEDTLDVFVDTMENTAAYTVDELENDQMYYFAVKAVDTTDFVSEAMSSVTFATPIASEPIAPDPALSALPSGVVQGIASQNSVTLEWGEFDGVRAYYYKIYFGLQSGQYDDYVVTPDNSTTYTVSDLINGIPYYFAVVALDVNRNEISPFSQEFVITPSGPTFHASAPGSEVISSQPTSEVPNHSSALSNVPRNEKTGPEAIWIVVASLVCAHFLYHQRRKLIK